MNVHLCAMVLAGAGLLAIATSRAHAQDSPAAVAHDPQPPAAVANSPSGWPSSPEPPTPLLGPRVERVPTMSWLVFGTTLLVVGYGAAILIAVWSIDTLPFGDPTCSDLYGGFHLVPVVGAPIGIAAAAACFRGTLRVEEVLYPILSGAPQLAGAILLLVGLIGHDAITYDGRDTPIRITIRPAFDRHFAGLVMRLEL
jgi:hypothetical protein